MITAEDFFKMGEKRKNALEQSVLEVKKFSDRYAETKEHSLIMGQMNAFFEGILESIGYLKENIELLHRFKHLPDSTIGDVGAKIIDCLNSTDRLIFEKLVSYESLKAVIEIEEKIKAGDVPKEK